MLCTNPAAMLLLLACALQAGVGAAALDTQVVFAPGPKAPNSRMEHVVDDDILAALREYRDPVAALISLRPDAAAKLAEPRLLHVAGERVPEWMSEGDKLRLRRSGRKFMDITDHRDFYAQHVEASLVPKASKSPTPGSCVCVLSMFTLLQTYRN